MERLRFFFIRLSKTIKMKNSPISTSTFKVDNG
jgi:hypothetical protein